MGNIKVLSQGIAEVITAILWESTYDIAQCEHAVLNVSCVGGTKDFSGIQHPAVLYEPTQCCTYFSYSTADLKVETSVGRSLAVLLQAYSPADQTYSTADLKAETSVGRSLAVLLQVLLSQPAHFILKRLSQ